MPKPVQADWELIKALFLQGFTQRQIAARTGVKPGTIKGRATRYGWSLLRRQANGALVSDPSCLAHQGLATLVQQQSKALAKASAQAQQALSGEVEAQLAVLSARKPRSLAELGNTSKREGRASVAARLVQAADKLYQWSENTSLPATLNLTQVNVSQAKPEGTVKVIDVPPD